MDYWSELAYWGKKYYNTKRRCEFKRYIVYKVRGFFNRRAMEDMLEFFNTTPNRRRFAEENSFVIPLTTRAVFYKDPKLADVAAMVKGTVGFLEEYYQTDMFDICRGRDLWQTDFNGEILSIHICCNDQMEKEGILTIDLQVSGNSVYKIALCIAPDKQNNGELAFYIGAMQGMHGAGAAEFIKALTKFCFAYRTKNLILYAVREIAKVWGIKHIYAVSNGGYFANSHMRVDKKIKTDLDGFWQETGGVLAEDKIFYKLPVEEYRKSLEEVKTHKRNLYRKRFALLDEISDSIKTSLAVKR